MKQFRASKKSYNNYQRVHYWLLNQFGKADRCENPNCKRISKLFQYALIKGKRYVKNRKMFTRLCRSCHAKYDATSQGIRRMAKANRVAKPTLWKQVDGYKPASQKIASWNSLTEAAKHLNVNIGNISRALKESFRTVRGFKLKYKSLK